MWSHRPRLLHLGLFFAAYFLGCAFAEVLGIVPGTDIAIWPPGGLFMATLIVAPQRTWPWWLLVGCFAEMLSQLVWFHSPLPAGFLMYLGNALAATAGAYLMNRAAGRVVRLDSMREVLAFVVLGAVVAPALSATVGAAAIDWFDVRSQTFMQAWPLWWIGDATGVLIVAPFALAVLQNWRGVAPLSAARWIEASALGLVLLGVAAFSLSGPLPFAYLIMPPLLWAAVRFEFRGAVVALTILALITIAFTIAGAGQFAGDTQSQREKLIMLQLFLGISALSALIVAAISRQHQLAMQTLRQSMETLREREAKIRRLVDSDIIGIVIWDLDGQLIDANDAFLRMVQYKREDLQAGLGWFDMTPPDWQEVHALEEAEELATTGMMQAREKEYFRKDGSRVPVLIGAACFEGESRQGVAYILDLTERKRAEAALRDRERELSQLVDMVPSYLWRITPDGVPVFFNKRFVDFLGWDVTGADKPDRSRLVALIEAAIHPDDAAGAAEAFDRSLASGERLLMKWRMRRADGVYRWMAASAEAMRDQDGRIAQWYGLCHDIDDQVRAEEALRESERKLQEIIDAVPVRIWSAAPNDGPVYFNKRYQDHFRSVIADFDALEQPRIEALLQELIHPDEASGVERTLGRCFASGDGAVMRFRWREKDDAYRWAECRVEPRRDQSGAIVQWYGASVDIDDEVRAQEELRRTRERLAQASQAASLAELSASIAHEVNQPLAAVVANSHACQRWLTADPPNLDRAQTTVERIIRDANGAADVVGRIRALFKQNVPARTFLALGSVMDEVKHWAADLAMRHGVLIETFVDAGVPAIAFDQVQIQQVLINLVRNAVEAMETSSGARILSVRACKSGEVVQVEVRDTGRGVEHPEKIFDAFFTTKGSGMGMGLAISRSIVESHGGRLWVEKNDQGGSSFIFTLPIQAPAGT